VWVKTACDTPCPPNLLTSWPCFAVYEQYLYDLGEGAQVSAAEFVDNVNEDNVRSCLPLRLSRALMRALAHS